MNIHGCFPSHYIKADLLKPSQELTLVIREIKLEEVDEGVSKPDHDRVPRPACPLSSPATSGATAARAAGE